LCVKELDRQGIIRINEVILKPMVKISFQLNTIEKFKEIDRHVIKNSAKKLILATSIIIVHELIHLKVNK